MHRTPTEKEKGGKSAPKSTKFGDVRKCPVCGALVPALAVSCAECGYEFSGVNASSSAQKLAQQISEIRKQVKDEFLANEQIVSLIDTFPVPNTKNDLFDMIIFLKNRSLFHKCQFIYIKNCTHKVFNGNSFFFRNYSLIAQKRINLNTRKHSFKHCAF